MSDTLRKNYSELFNSYSLPGWKLDYGKLERMVSEADAELTALRAKLAEAERELKASEQERDDVLAKFVQQSEKHRAEAAEARVKELEAKLAAVREAYDRWMAERQGFIQTLMAIGDLVKE